MTDLAAPISHPIVADAERSGKPLRDPFAELFRLLVLLLVAGVVIVPLLATALGGFKSLGELRVNTFGIPHEWVWSNYGDILAGGSIGVFS